MFQSSRSKQVTIDRHLLQLDTCTHETLNAHLSRTRHTLVLVEEVMRESIWTQRMSNKLKGAAGKCITGAFGLESRILCGSFRCKLVTVLFDGRVARFHRLAMVGAVVGVQPTCLFPNVWHAVVVRIRGGLLGP